MSSGAHGTTSPEVIDARALKGSVKITIVAARFNQFITDQLISGAMNALAANGIAESDIRLVWVPGAFELPLAADLALAGGSCDGVIALGAVIRGGTAHFDFVAGECARGLSRVAIKRGQPVMFGVLTTDTIEQALERAAPDQGNKGFDVALGLVHMLSLAEQLAERTMGK